MPCATILLTCLVVSLAVFLFHRTISALNVRHATRHGGELPPELASRFTPVQLARSLDYLRARTAFGHVNAASALALAWFWLFSGILTTLAAAVLRLTPGPVLAGLLLLAAVSLIDDLADLPFSWHETFRLEARFGFNRTTAETFWADFGKGLLLKAFLGIPLVMGVLKLVEVLPNRWWLAAALFVIAFQILILWLFPRFLAPIFNKFTPLPEGALRTLLEDTARRGGFPVQGIFVMDGSKRSSHANAYFAGFGRHRRLVLYDTLISRLTPEQLAAVVAHEIGHGRHRHILKMLLLMSAVVLGAGWAAYHILNWPLFAEAFGINPGLPAQGLLLIGLAAPPFLTWLAPLLHHLQRRFEFEADAFAVRACGSAAPLREALLVLLETNLQHPNPLPLYSLLHDSHPAAADRLRALDRVL